MRLHTSAPVFVVSDVAATMQWYEIVLGFQGHGFPKNPPYAFGIMQKDGVEIMLQRLDGYRQPDVYAQRDGGTWDVYIRMEGVHELWGALSKRDDVTVLEAIGRQPYGDTEFVVRDPNGYVLVFSELINSPA